MERYQLLIIPKLYSENDESGREDDDDDDDDVAEEDASK